MTEKTPLGKPPCGSCKKCCTGWQAVALYPDLGDDPTKYEVMLAGEVLLLAFKENGDCVYLGENGCTIHGHAPAVCREFDCRGTFLMSTRNERRQMMKGKNMDDSIYKRGRELLHTLDDEGRRDCLMLRQQNIGRAINNNTVTLDKAMGKKEGVVANVLLGPKHGT